MQYSIDFPKDRRHVIEGLVILFIYDQDDYISAEHDQIWYSTTDPNVMQKAHLARLEEIGWRYKDGVWAAFV